VSTSELEPGAGGAARALLLPAVRALVAEARARRAALSTESAARQFYLGVEAAAAEVLHPQTTASRAPGWLEREPSQFRDGYLRTGEILRRASSGAEPPVHIPLPAVAPP